MNILLPELGKQSLMHELASKAEAMTLLESNIDVSTSQFIYNVVVSKNLFTILLLCDLIETLANLVGELVDRVSYETLHNEIELGHFLILFIDDLVLMIVGVESPWHETSR